MLDRLEEERRANRAAALSAQEAERQRVAQELHDEVGQSLTVVLLGLTQAIDKAPADVRSVCSELTRYAIRAGLVEP